MEISFDFFSPEQILDHPLSKVKKVEVSIKRDDMIHPFISGNKWRKLKYILLKARGEQKNHLVTFGGAWSNHLLATACAAAQFQFQCTGYVRGEQVENPVLSLCRLFGMNIHFVNREEYTNKEAIYAKHHDVDSSAFFIDEGGFSLEATKGCEEIITELKGKYDHVFVACGTGTTIAGIAKGAAKFCPAMKVHGVPVLKGGEFVKKVMMDLGSESPVILHTSYHFGGYAKTKPELIDFVKGFCAKTGIMIEPVYTGKLFYAVMDLMSKNYFKENERILIVHSGGLTGFLGHHLKF